MVSAELYELTLLFKTQEPGEYIGNMSARKYFLTTLELSLPKKPTSCKNGRKRRMNKGEITKRPSAKKLDTECVAYGATSRAVALIENIQLSFSQKRTVSARTAKSVRGREKMKDQRT